MAIRPFGRFSDHRCRIKEAGQTGYQLLTPILASPLLILRLLGVHVQGQWFVLSFCNPDPCQSVGLPNILYLRINVRNFLRQTLKISKVSLVFMGS
jgi:hypothetical protein